MKNAWNPDLYQQNHSFVWQLGQGLVDLLDPQPGEQVLDIGCGTGQLTQAIAARGAIVQGIDADPAMIEAAQQHFPGLTFWVADAREVALDQPADAIFSNAALHWIADPDRVAERMRAAMKPGARLVVEFGGNGNVETIRTAIAKARADLGLGNAPTSPWYFPSISDYTGVLERQGFEVQFAQLYDRPTPLEGESGLRNWLQMFAGHFLADVSSDHYAAAVDAIEAIARPTLFRAGQWWADYRRIRVLAYRL